MMSESEFLEWLERSGDDPELFTQEIGNFDDVAEAALKAWRAMPGIGFASVAGRMNCFVAVCRHLDAMIEDGHLERHQAQTSLAILAIKDKKFRKAMRMFDMRCNRYSLRDRIELPDAAQDYILGREAQELGARYGDEA